MIITSSWINNAVRYYRSNHRKALVSIAHLPLTLLRILELFLDVNDWPSNPLRGIDRLICLARGWYASTTGNPWGRMVRAEAFTFLRFLVLWVALLLWSLPFGFLKVCKLGRLPKCLFRAIIDFSSVWSMVEQGFVLWMAVLKMLWRYSIIGLLLLLESSFRWLFITLRTFHFLLWSKAN